MNPDPTLELYLIGLKKGRTGYFCPTDQLEAFEASSDDKVHRFIVWLSTRPWRVLAWFGRVFKTGHGYYIRFEARIDPFERILKAMASTKRLRIVHSPSVEPEAARRRVLAKLRFQKVKHLFWFILDLVISVGALALAFIPGPNVVGWYPFLRSLSHYGAFRGTRAASVPMEFKCLPELRRLEENLQAPILDVPKVHAVVEDLKLSGLEQFIERMI